MHLHIEFLVESLSTIFTLEVLVAFVILDMSLETTYLGESLLTGLNWTLKWLLTCVSSEMHKEFHNA